MSFWSKIKEAAKSPEQKFGEAHELVKNSDPGGRIALEALLAGRTTRMVQCQAAALLAEMRDPRSIPALAAARTHPDDFVRKAAVAALDRIDPIWRKRPEARPAAEYDIREILGQLTPFIKQSGTLLRDAVERYDQEPVRKAVSNLVTKGDDLTREIERTYDLSISGPVLSPLKDLVEKAKAVAAEGDKRQGSASGGLGLQDLAAKVMPALAKAEGLLATAEKLMPLLKLVEAKDPRAWEALQSAIQDPDPILRFRAAAAMGQLGDLRSVPALKAAITDADERVRQNVEASLDRLDPGWRTAPDPASSADPSGATSAPPGSLIANRQKAREIDVDQPTCFSCGKPLAGGESMLGGGGAPTFVFSSRSAEKIKDDYRLFNGTVCFSCAGVFCLDCAGQPIDRCPQCQGKTAPAMRKELVELRTRVGAS